MPLAAGTRFGPYEILAPIGAGGMGEVYRSRDTRLDRIVAIKVLPEHLSINPQSRERFEREAKAISGLSHPHICPLYDVGQQDGVDYLVMEYLEGETIATRLKKGPLPLDQALTCAIQIAGALDQAHRAIAGGEFPVKAVWRSETRLLMITTVRLKISPEPSGAMYWNVPKIAPSRVDQPRESVRANSICRTAI
jgi:serine/threonine protein kinase